MQNNHGKTMYIIVSVNSKYRGKLIGKDALIRSNTIGHEIHITRPLLYFLLSKRKISENDVIVTRSKERFFFYSNIFRNIIEYDELPENIPGKFILDLTHANTLIENYKNHDFLLDMEIKMHILHELRNQNILVQTDLFKFYMSSFDYLEMDYDFLSTQFVIIHNRQVPYSNVSLNINITRILIEIILALHPELTIVVFSSTHIDYVHEKVKYVSKLPTYASLMNHPNCQAVISEFSGAGQLAHYCHHKNIIYYFGEYFFEHNNNLEELIKKANDTHNMYLHFDLKKTTNSNMFIYKKHSDMFFGLINDNIVYRENAHLPFYKIM